MIGSGEKEGGMTGVTVASIKAICILMFRCCIFMGCLYISQ